MCTCGGLFHTCKQANTNRHDDAPPTLSMISNLWSFEIILQSLIFWKWICKDHRDSYHPLSKCFCSIFISLVQQMLNKLSLAEGSSKEFHSQGWWSSEWRTGHTNGRLKLWSPTSPSRHKPVTPVLRGKTEVDPQGLWPANQPKMVRSRLKKRPFLKD